MNTVKSTYIKRKIAPPFCPITYGKRQILPSPTAHPNVAIINAKPDDQFALFAALLYIAIFFVPSVVKLYIYNCSTFYDLQAPMSIKY